MGTGRATRSLSGSREMSCLVPKPHCTDYGQRQLILGMGRDGPTTFNDNVPPNSPGFSSAGRYLFSSRLVLQYLEDGYRCKSRLRRRQRPLSVAHAAGNWVVFRRWRGGKNDFMEGAGHGATPGQISANIRAVSSDGKVTACRCGENTHTKIANLPLPGGSDPSGIHYRYIQAANGWSDDGGLTT